MASPILIGQLQPTPPYDFTRTCDVLRRFVYPSVDHVRGDAYLRVLRVGPALALIRVTQSVSGVLDVHLMASSAPVEPAALLHMVAHILGTTLDLRDFYATARKHSELWHVVGPIVGVRMLRSPSMFEALMSTIIEQQIAWVAAQRAQQWLVDWGGDGIQHNGEMFFTFPTPERIAAASVDEFKPLKITFRRMGLLIDIAARINAGTLDIEGLRDESSPAIYDALVAIKGVGHWTATYTLTRSFGPLHPYTGTNDVALQAAVNHYFYGGTGRIPPQQVAETFAPYGKFAGVAALHTILRWVIDRYESK